MQRTLAILLIILALIGNCSAQSETPFFKNLIKGRLLFEISPTDPQQLNVYLRLVNGQEGEVAWTCSGTDGVDAEVLDATGHPFAKVDLPNVDLISFPETFTLPADSRFEWCLTWSDLSLTANPNKAYNLSIGSSVWLIPKDKAASFSVRLRLHGWIGHTAASEKHNPNESNRGNRLLLDIPAQKIVITRPPAD